MTTDVYRAAFSVLMPIVSGRALSADVRQHLRSGGVSILLGDTGDAPATRVSYQRSLAASRRHFAGLMAQVEACTGSPVLMALDQELGGIQRFCQPLPGLSASNPFRHMSTEDIELRSCEQASCARAMGINMFLAPTVYAADSRRCIASTVDAQSALREHLRVAGAFIRGVQRAGIIATARYLIPEDNTEHKSASKCSISSDIRADVGDAVSVHQPLFTAGAHAVMPWPAVFPPQRGPDLHSRCGQPSRGLREMHGFDALVVSDDLQAVSILNGASVAQAAVAALNAGADLMIVTAASSLDELTGAIVDAVDTGNLSTHTLLVAADRVREAARASRAQVDAGLYVSYPIADGHMTRRVVR